jgi:nucleotide-binding universal stress UspA family protein
MIDNLYKSTATSKASDVQELFIDIRKILLATDGSQSSIKATEQAIAWASFFEADVRAIYVENDFEMLESPYIETEKHLKGKPGTGKCSEVLEAVKTYAEQNDVSIETRVLRGQIARTIADYAEVYGPDLIIIGNSEKSGLKRSLGSVVDAVMKSTDVPVLVISDN